MNAYDVPVYCLGILAMVSVVELFRDAMRTNSQVSLIGLLLNLIFLINILFYPAMPTWLIVCGYIYYAGNLSSLAWNMDKKPHSDLRNIATGLDIFAGYDIDNKAYINVLKDELNVGFYFIKGIYATDILEADQKTLKALGWLIENESYYYPKS